MVDLTLTIFDTFSVSLKLYINGYVCIYVYICIQSYVLVNNISHWFLGCQVIKETITRSIFQNHHNSVQLASFVPKTHKTPTLQEWRRTRAEVLIRKYHQMFGSQRLRMYLRLSVRASVCLPMYVSIYGSVRVS